MTLLVIIVLSAVTGRVTRLVTTDEITRPLRLRLTRRYPALNRPVIREQTGEPIPDSGTLTPQWPVKLITCHWCMSFWIAIIVVAIAWASGFLHATLGGYIWYGAAVAGLGGLFAHWSV